MTDSHWFFNPAGCGCCQRSSDPNNTDGRWLCGRCSQIPIRYKLTVPDTSLASLSVRVLARYLSTNVSFEHVFDNVASFGGEHVLRRARSNTVSYNPTDPEPYQVAPFVDETGYFVFPYNRQTIIPGSSNQVSVLRDVRPCSWFGNYTDHNYNTMLNLGDGLVGVSAVGVDHFWRLRMDYAQGVVRVEGPSSFTNWPLTLSGDDGALNFHQGRIGVVYQIEARHFQCMGKTILPNVTDNPRALGWPPEVIVEAIEDDEP